MHERTDHDPVRIRTKAVLLHIIAEAKSLYEEVKADPDSSGPLKKRALTLYSHATARALQGIEKLEVADQMLDVVDARSSTDVGLEQRLRDFVQAARFEMELSK